MKEIIEIKKDNPTVEHAIYEIAFLENFLPKRERIKTPTAGKKGINQK